MFKIDKLKSEQREILNCLLSKRDCVAVLPTGYGKSLPYQIYIPVARTLHQDVGKIIVCCPLISLMEDQVMKLSNLEGVTAAYKGIIAIHITQ